MIETMPKRAQKSDAQTITLTVTWESAVRIYIAALDCDGGDNAGKRAAREELMRLARHADQIAKDTEQEKTDENE